MSEKSTDRPSSAPTCKPSAKRCRTASNNSEKKLSQDELSRRAGVSKGMLVEIEKGSANPSIAILCKLAAALGLSVADIVNVTRAPAAYLIESQDIPTLWHGDRGGSARLLAGTRGPNMIELWRWEMAPGKPMHRAAIRRAPSNCCTLNKAS